MAQPENSPRPDRADAIPARDRYLEGEKHYAAGRYELAVQEFQAALDLSAKPELHFNIANCHERAGNYASAAMSLQAFLDSGQAPEPEILRERIWRLKQRTNEQQVKLDKLVEERTKELRAQIREQGEQDSVLAGPQTEAPSFVPSYIVLGSGAAAITGAMIFAGISRAAGSDAAADCTQQICAQSAKQALDKETRYARAADVSGLVGLAALGVGGYLWYRTSQKEEQWNMRVGSIGHTESVGVFINARF